MNTIKQRAHEYAQEHYMKNGVSIMRAYIAGARDERRYFIKPLRIKIFVSGKISGEDYYQAYQKFSTAEKRLEAMGGTYDQEFASDCNKAGKYSKKILSLKIDLQ